MALYKEQVYIRLHSTVVKMLHKNPHASSLCNNWKILVVCAHCEKVSSIKYISSIDGYLLGLFR